HHAQARAHDGWRCDRNERARQGLGVYGAPAERRAILTSMVGTYLWGVSTRRMAATRLFCALYCDAKGPRVRKWQEAAERRIDFNNLHNPQALIFEPPIELSFPSDRAGMATHH